MMTRDAVSKVQDVLQTTAKNVSARLVPGKTAKDVWDLQLDPILAQDALHWADCKAVHQDVTTNLDVAKEVILAKVMPIFAQRIFSSKTKPSNPSLDLQINGSTKHRFQIWLVNNFSFGFSKKACETHTEDAYVDELHDIGISMIAARNLVQNELKLQTVVGFRNLNDLQSGSYNDKGDWLDSSEVEKRAAAKIEAWLGWDGVQPLEALSGLEKDACTVKKNVIVVRPGFLDRIHQYAGSPQDILAIWQLIRPSVFPTRLEFCVGEPEGNKSDEKLDFAKKIFATS